MTTQLEDRLTGALQRVAEAYVPDDHQIDVPATVAVNGRRRNTLAIAAASVARAAVPDSDPGPVAIIERAFNLPAHAPHPPQDHPPQDPPQDLLQDPLQHLAEDHLQDFGSLSLQVSDAPAAATRA